MQNQLAELYVHYTLYDYIVDQLSGSSVDQDSRLPTASEECWEDFIRVQLIAFRLHTKPFPPLNGLGKEGTSKYDVNSSCS